MKPIYSALFAILLLACAPARAEMVDPLIEGAKLCTRHLPRYEREYGIPTHLLSAIASTESGRYHEGLKIKVPWPWTINADGKGYIFDSKEEAIAAVRHLRGQGIQSIDVGCMQVNLYHHPQAFSSLEQAFEPESNVAYAAGFLRGLYEEEGSWKKAAADYHSKTPRLGNEYAGLVYDSWYRIIDRLRAARLAVPESSVMAMNMMKSETLADSAPSSTAASMAAVPAKSSKLPEQIGKKVAAYQAPHMRIIQVSQKASSQDNSSADNGSRDNGIIIVKPDIKLVDDPVKPVIVQTQITSSEPPLVMTVAQTLPAPLPQADSAQAGITRLDHTRVSDTPDTSRSGPHFIFND